MKKFFISCLSILFFLMILFSQNIMALDNNINIENYPKNTRERYIASIAIEKGISYAEAEALENKIDNEKIIPTLPPKEVIRYKTIDKRVGYIEGDGNRKVNMATEVKYVVSFSGNRFSRIENIGNPYIYIPGTTNGRIDRGDFNVEVTPKQGRISVTGALTYHRDFAFGINVGNDIVQINGNIYSGLDITTKAKTFVMYIRSSDL